jgi:hypothetical protein
LFKYKKKKIRENKSDEKKNIFLKFQNFFKKVLKKIYLLAIDCFPKQTQLIFRGWYGLKRLDQVIRKVTSAGRVRL